MKKIFLSLMLSFMMVAQPANAVGLFFTCATHPLTATCLRACKDLSCLRQGKSHSINILYLFEVGDGGISAAAANACMKQVYFVDITESSFFIIFKKTTTTVYGD